MTDQDSRGFLSKLTSKFSDRREQKVSEWFTPWMWTDSARLYYGEDGAWVYMSVPNSLMAKDPQTLAKILNAPCFTQERAVHLLAHTWSTPVTTPPDVPERMLELLESALQLPSPLHSFTVGVKLASTSADKSGVLDGIDAILGERIPDLSSFDADRDFVVSHLSQLGLVPLTQTQADHLEYWYTLGSPSDPVVSEEESCIEFGGVSTLVCLSVSDVDTTDTPTALPGSGRGTAATLSVRGTAADGRVKDASIVVARRSSSFTPWEDTLAASNGSIKTQPLPMRQLPALSETLPCSKVRVNPLMESLTVTQMRNLGYTSDTTVGDENGLFVGVSGADLSTLAWWNPLQDFASTLSVCGGAGSGKTFLLEFLSHQAHAAGLRVRYLSADGESGRPLVQNLGMTGVSNPSSGLADPGSFPYDTVQTTLAELCAEIVPAVPKREWIEAANMVLVSDPHRTHPACDLSTLLPSTALVAHVTKATRSDAAARMVLGAGGWPSTDVAVSLPHLMKDIDPARREAVEDALIASALNIQDEVPTLVILDGVRCGPLASAAIARAHSERQPVGVAQAHWDRSAFLNSPSTTKMILGESDVDTARGNLEWVGVPTTYAQLGRVTNDLAPHVDDGVVLSPARFLLKDRRGRKNSGVVAPLRDDELRVLSRGRANEYLR